MKKCFKCLQMLELEMFYTHPDMPDGRVNKCKECTKQAIRARYAETITDKRNYDSYRNRHSISRIFSHKYAWILERCTQIHKTRGIKKSVYWSEFLSKEEWLAWCYDDENYKVFISLYNNWVQHNFERKLAPSIDRKDSNLWYVVDNLQWLTLSENCQKYNK